MFNTNNRHLWCTLTAFVLIILNIYNRCYAESSLQEEYKEKHLIIDAQMYLKLRKPLNAITLLNKVKHENNLIHKFNYLTKAYLLEKNYARAEESANMCIKLEPDYSRWYTRYAMIQEFQNKSEVALKYYKIAYNKGDTSKETMEGLAGYYTLHEENILMRYIYGSYLVKQGINRYPESDFLKLLDKLTVVWLKLFVLALIPTIIVLFITLKLFTTYVLKFKKNNSVRYNKY